MNAILQYTLYLAVLVVLAIPLGAYIKRVMFGEKTFLSKILLVCISAFLTTVLWLVSLFGIRDVSSAYTLAIAVVLWFTVLFANFAEAIAEAGARRRRMWPLP